MSFVTQLWWLWLGAGALAASIPVIIHMIHTTRAPEVPFPTLRFLRSASEKTARRRKIENLLLMILRMLLFALLALALSRPFLSEKFGLFGGEDSGAAVLVLDNSYSMGVQSAGETRFGKAKKEARAILESPWKPALAAVLLTNPGALPVPDRLGADRAKVFSDIERAQISSARADLTGTLKKAYALLDKTDSSKKRLWVITDRQNLSWRGLADLEEPRKHADVPVAVIRATEPSYTNVGITDAEVVSTSRVVGLPIRFDATVRNGTPSPEKRNLLLFVDDFNQPRQKVPVELQAAGTSGATKTVAVTHVFDAPGPHRVLFAFEGTDALAADNSRHVAVQIANKIPVLVLKQKASEVAFQDADFYLLFALNPGGADWSIQPTETLAGLFDTRDLSKYEAVFLNNVGEVTPGLAKALADYVAAGRTLVVFLGPEVSPERYNQVLVDGVGRGGGLLPARLKERVGDAVLKTTVEKVTQVQGQSPYLKDLVETADIYQDIITYEYFRADAPGDSVLARLSGGDPFLMHKAFGQGHVLLFATTGNRDWTNFPVQNLFMPLMMRIVHLSTRGQTERLNLLAGQPFETNFYPALTETVTAEVTGPLGPSGETVSEQLDTKVGPGRNTLRFEKTWNLGYYAYRVPSVPGLAGTFCTNPDGSESDLAEVADDPLQHDIGAAEAHVAGSLADLEKRFKDTAHRELWQYFLTICLALAIAEPLVANWMRPKEARKTAHPVEGSRTKAA
jgi:hypothetical protein